MDGGFYFEKFLTMLTGSLADLSIPTPINDNNNYDSSFAGRRYWCVKRRKQYDKEEEAVVA